MKKLILATFAVSVMAASSVAANPVLYANSVQQECRKEVENSDAFGLSIRKKSNTAVSIRFKKVKTKKIENAAFRQAKSEFKACMES